MGLIQVVVNAIVTGAALMYNTAGTPAIGDAYRQVKAVLASKYGDVDLARIEARPDSARGRDYLAEDLRDSGALNDPAVLAAVLTLIEVIHHNQGATQAALKIGVDMTEVHAAALKLVDILGDDVAVRLHKSVFREGIEIRTAQGGQAKTGAPTYILTGNQAGKIVFGSDDQPDFAALEQHYLHGLYGECNELPLANDGPVDATRQRSPRLQHVYVDLAVHELPRAHHIRERLVKTGLSLEKIEQWLVRMLTGKGGRAVYLRETEHGELEMVDVGPSNIDEQISAEPLLYLEELQSLTAEAVLKLENSLGYPEGVLRDAVYNSLRVLEVISEEAQLVLLGDPGGGKSTLTRRLAGVLASRALTTHNSDEAQWLAELTQLWGRWLLPVRIVLSRWTQHLAPDAQGTAADLIDECVRLLGQTAEVRGLKEHLMTRLTADPPTALILLDGLDEVADKARRATLLKAVKHFSERYKAVPLIVTCRIRPWQAWTTEGSALALPVFTIDKLTSDAITAFVKRWHAELVWTGRYTPEAAEAAQRRLLNAIANPNRKDLADMAGTPLLLTMMARVNYERGLPDSRAELYEVYLRQLLWEWERQKLDDQGQPTSLQILLAQGKVDEASLERKLSQLAYEVHGSGGEQDTVDISRAVVREALEAIHPGNDEAKAAWAVAMLRLLDDRSGLLQSLDARTYQFSHRTFQEFLAARWLATGNFRKKYREKIDQEGWREAIALALSYQIRVLRQYEDALSVIFAFFPATATDEADWRRVLLLGEAYVRLLGPQRASESEQAEIAAILGARIPQQLTAAMQNRDLPPQQRLAAGHLLAELGIDPPGLDDFISAPGWNFQIGRYPVTNKQFRRFVEAGGYRDDRWWTDEKGRQYRDEGNWTAPRFWDDQEFNWPTQPVVGVSWYEAQAYCVWLTHELRQTSIISAQEEVCLPTETEWEAAAHSHDGRAYPWGNAFDEHNANTVESVLNQTTPVDMYRDGTTPEGVWGLIGDVWEWSQDDHESWGKVIRGDGFHSRGFETATRSWDHPDRRHNDNGFRCVVVPISR